MIVDCHTHLHCAERGGLVEDHRRASKGVDACFVLAGLSEDRQDSNSQLDAYLRQTSKAYGFAAVNPLYDDISAKRLKALCKEDRMIGLVLYCAEEDFHPAHSRALQLYEAAQEQGLILFFHNSPPFSPPAVLD